MRGIERAVRGCRSGAARARDRDNCRYGIGSASGSLHRSDRRADHHGRDGNHWRCSNNSTGGNTPSNIVVCGWAQNHPDDIPSCGRGGDTTGIASSPAPSSSARVSPDLGSYGVDIAGSASVGGRAQRVPTSGSVIFKSSGANVRQTSPDAPGDVVLLQRFTGDKSELVSLELTAGDTHKTFTPSSNATYLLYNSPSGTSWSWSATSTDGKTHVNASGHIGGSKDYNVGGIVVHTVEVVTNLQISGDITGSAELTTWASPEYRLPIVQHQHIDASTRGLLGLSVRLLSDTTTTLRSVTPN